MRKVIMIAFCIGVCFFRANLYASPLNDTSALLKQIFKFFNDNEYIKKTGKDSVLRNQYSPKFYELFLKDSFPLLGRARLRSRKAGCFTFKELVFSIGIVKDTAITRLWKKREFPPDHAKKIDEWLLNGIVDHAWRDSINYKLDDSYFLNGFGKKYDRKIYEKNLLILDEDTPNVILDLKSRRRIVFWGMLETIRKDVYEIQLVFSEFKDDCFGI